MKLKHTSNPLADIRISHGMIIQGDPTRTATLTQGYRITSVAIESASNLLCNQVEDALRSMLLTLPSEYSLQMRFTNSGDYSPELMTYYETTERHANRWSKEQRNYKYAHIHDLIHAGLLSRKEVHLFFSRKTTEHSPRAKRSPASIEELDSLLKAEQLAFEPITEQLKHALSLVGGRVEQLDNKELFHEFDKALNPSFITYDKEIASSRFESGSSVSQCCLHSDMVANGENGFYYDGMYHAVIALKALPGMTTSGQIVQLSGLPIKDYSITVLASRLDLEQELTKEEKKAITLERALGSGGKMRLKQGLQKSINRIDRLASGDVAPYSIQFIIHCWDKEFDVLQNTKLTQLKSAVLRFQRAQYFSINNPVMAKNFFLSTLPGSPVREKAFIHKTDDVTVANLLPVSSNNDGNLKNAEAIYQTSNNGLLGLSLFKNVHGKPYTNHTFICGKTGYGKSCNTGELLTQIQPHTDSIFIIEDGNSHGGYVSTFGEEANSFFIDTEASDSLNYLDTSGLPLTARHRSDVESIMKLMITEQDTALISSAKIGELAYRFYQHHFQLWKRDHPGQFSEACTEFLVASKYMELKNQTGAICKRWPDYLEWKNKYPSEYSTLREQCEGFEIGQITTDLFHCSFAFMTPEQSATHSQLHDWVCTLNESEPSTLLDTLQSNLRIWRADSGRYGCLFDGVSTVRFDGPINHIELGRIGEDQDHLKKLAAFIVSGRIRNTITLMPRNKRKLVVFEELGRFLTFDNAERIVADFFNRGRKYNACVLVIVQHPSELPTPLMNCVCTNSSLGMFFRQDNEDDVALLQQKFKLPEATALTLSHLATPTAESGSDFICWQSGDSGPAIHRACNPVSREMLYAIDSSGDKYEERQEAMKQHDDVIEGIRIEARKSAENDAR